MDDAQRAVKELVLDPGQFVRLTVRPVTGATQRWRRVLVRPVLVKGRRHLQFSYFDEKRDVSKNYRDQELEAKLDELLRLPMHGLHLETTHEVRDLHVLPSGQTRMRREQTGRAVPPPDPRHDVVKPLPLPADQPDPFLQAVGIMDEQGRVRPGMRDKFTQVNEFLKLLEHTGELARLNRRPVTIVDCGCGAALLTLATYHYLTTRRGIEAQVVGLDLNAELLEQDEALVARLGLADVCFSAGRIADYVPEAPPDVVLALHACDTATDEAIAQGIRWGARLIMCAPCCHHELHSQLRAVEPLRPLFRHGILKQRLADVLTDAFRAHILRLMGYRTDVVEFVSTEHTDRNVLIRAVKRRPPGDFAAAQEYVALKEFWQVTPYLETLLREQLIGVVPASPTPPD